MKQDALFLMQRPFIEIADDLLTSLIGGVVNEAIGYDVKSDFYPLTEPAAAIRGITGTRGGERTTFLQEVDYVFSVADNAILWQGVESAPDDETTFYVDYARKYGKSPLTDINVGSVARTLVEAVGREIATLYSQVFFAYESGFLDTATGKSLEKVVSILGITRKTADAATGLVAFFRDPAVKGTITIPQGTLVSAKEGGASFETTEPRTMQLGAPRVDIPILATQGFEGPAGQVAPGLITELARPIAGIARISNTEATRLLLSEDESDEGLRDRARLALRALGTATIPALRRVAAERGANVAEIRDPGGSGAETPDPGTVTLVLEGEPERVRSATDAINETRAAGVLAQIITRHLYLKPRLTVFTNTDVTGPGKVKLKNQIIAKLQELVDSLGKGATLSGTQMITAISEIEEVSGGQFADLLVWRGDGETSQEELKLDAMLAAIAGFGAAPDGAAPGGAAPGGEGLREKLRDILNAHFAPDGGANASEHERVVSAGDDGELVQADFRDDKTSAGGFEIQSQTAADDQPRWFALDMDEADILLQAGGN